MIDFELLGKIDEVFKHWKKVMGKSNSNYITKRREKAIRDRLEENFTVEQLKKAIDGCKKAPFYMGENKHGREFNDITLICADEYRVLLFIDYDDGKI